MKLLVWPQRLSSELARLGRPSLALLLCASVGTLHGCGSPKPAPPPPESTLGSAAAEVPLEPELPPPGNQSEPALPTEPAADAAPAAKWTSLFNGESLGDWVVTDFGGQGDVAVEDGVIVMQQGSEITGIHWKGKPLPTTNYELEWEAQRIEGYDFFGTLVFPAGEDFCSFVVGGWGGGVVGLSAVDHQYANENQTGSHYDFKKGEWYRLRLRVTNAAVQAWINDKQVVDLKLADRKLSLHPAVDLSRPLGLSCYSTVAGLRNIRIRTLTDADLAADAAPAKKADE